MIDSAFRKKITLTTNPILPTEGASGGRKALGVAVVVGSRGPVEETGGALEGASQGKNIYIYIHIHRSYTCTCHTYTCPIEEAGGALEGNEPREGRLV